MDKITTLSQLIEFSTVFDEVPKELRGYLSGISRDKLLTTTAFLLGFANRNSKFDSYYELLSIFFCAENNELANQIYKRLQTIESEAKVPLRIINPLTALQIFEYSFDHADESEIQTKAEIERNIFKAILFQNEENTTKQMEAFSSTQGIKMPARIPLLAMSQSLPFSELINYDQGELLAGQIIKSVFLFEFLESHPKTKLLLSAFLDHFGCETWIEYLKKIMPLAFSVIKNPNEAHTDISVPPGENFESDCDFIEKLIIKDSDSIEDYDFKKIRARPFYKVSDGVYRIIYNLFIIEILHKGVYFKLNELNKELNKTIPKSERIKNLRSFYCDDFSERYLLYTIMESIYAGRYVKYSGSDIKTAGLDAEPDYYIRTGESILLFESKDILLNAELKSSYNFPLHEAELGKKLYFEEEEGGKIANKAVLQLVKNIVRCLNLEIPVDNSYDPKRQKIYPIIILHDHIYRVSGLNFMVNQWYLAEVEKLRQQGIDVQNLRPLTIIDIDTFIFHQDILRAQKILLEEVIEAYHSYTSLTDGSLSPYVDILKQQVYDKSVSFSIFLTNVVKERNIFTAPKMIMEKGLMLFNRNDGDNSAK